MNAPKSSHFRHAAAGISLALSAVLVSSCGGGGTPKEGVHSVGGSVRGLASDGMVIANGADQLTVGATATAFTLPTSLPEGASYGLTLVAQPLGQRCSITGASGTVATTPVTSVAINCTSFQWAWVGGTSGIDMPAVYDLVAVPPVANQPGGRRDAVTWTDTSGNLWLFGGEGAFSGGTGYPNDLWEYSPATGQWTWVAGEAAALTPGVYGTQGIAAATNTPGGRHWATGWTDTGNRLWLFGGLGYDAAGNWGLLNDLWSFDPATGWWTWWTGSTVTYALSQQGTHGVADAANTPGARDNVVAWTDAAGNAWIYGGFGDEPTGQVRGALDELWMYAPSTGRWTWQAGSAQTNAIAGYGTQGTESTANSPGGRYGGAAWRDATGVFWMFGGSSYFGALNDLWRSNPATLSWTWVSGSNQPSAVNAYGTLGLASAGNGPGARSQSVAWADANGDLWLFGGYGYGPTYVLEYYNDLWVFRPSRGRWSWIAGASRPNTGGTYGTLGTAAVGNTPSARLGAAGWRDPGGRLWLYGGGGYSTDTTFGYLSDFWVFGTP